MKKLTAAMCCLMLAAAPLAWAQGTGAGNQAAPPTQKGQAEQKKRESQTRMADCINKAQRNSVRPGTTEFNRYIAGCLNG